MLKIKELINELQNQNLTISTFESATGGLIASSICQIPGASRVFSSALVTYQTESKIKLLKINHKKISKYGVISKEIAYEMVKKGCQQTKTLCGISVTGNAGPKNMDNKPNGLFYLGFKVRNNIYVEEIQLSKSLDRNKKRQKIVEISINYLLNLLKK